MARREGELKDYLFMFSLSSATRKETPDLLAQMQIKGFQAAIC